MKQHEAGAMAAGGVDVLVDDAIPVSPAESPTYVRHKRAWNILVYRASSASPSSCNGGGRCGDAVHDAAPGPSYSICLLV